MALVGCVRVSSQRCTWSGRGVTADVNADPVPMRDALGIEQQNRVLSPTGPRDAGPSRVLANY